MFTSLKYPGGTRCSGKSSWKRRKNAGMFIGQGGGKVGCLRYLAEEIS